jgi:hypothetical protein
MALFNVGDIAVVIANHSDHQFVIGQYVEITEVFCSGHSDEHYAARGALGWPKDEEWYLGWKEVGHWGASLGTKRRGFR